MSLEPSLVLSVLVGTFHSALAVLIRGLDKAGVRFGAVSVSRPTLDDVFLAATGGRMSDADAAGDQSEDGQARDREPASSGRRAP